MKEHIIEFLDSTHDSRELSEKCRDYKDNKQWTEEEVNVLKSRNQAAITINRIKNKVQGLIGLYISRRTDPKAYARTPKHEKASQAITDALRYSKDKNKLDHLKTSVADNYFVEGYGAVLITTDAKGDPLVQLIPWDRFYYDPRSTRKDFKDCRYMGIFLWLDEEPFLERGWSKSQFEACLGQEGLVDTDTFEDRPKFTDKTRRRVRVAQEYYLKNGEWREKFFCGDIKLTDNTSSELDEEGLPTNPIEAVAAYIDRENNRFGEVKYFLDLQDEINHRRSKFLALMSNRQTASRRGAIKDVNRIKRELAKPDGHVEVDGELKNDFIQLNTLDMADGQFNLMNSSMQEMDASTFNAELAGQRQGDLSGRTVEKLQAAGMLTTEELFFNLKAWEERVYTQMWWRILSNWNEEKWVRVTDDHDNLRYVGFNIQITLGQKLKETSEDTSLPQAQRLQAQQVLQMAQQVQDPQQAQQIAQQLSQPVEVSNPIPELEMDVIIEHSPDTINIQQEQLQMLFELAQARPEVPIEWLIDNMHNLRNKDTYKAQLQQMRQQQQQMQQTQLQGEETRKNEESKAKVAKDMATAQHTATDNVTEQIKQLVAVNNPPDEITANI